jgi:UDP-GlcNAc3NAcA epimerase
MKIVTIIGARPQFIKAAMVSLEIAKHKSIDEVLVHTGQHFDENMSDIFFDQMNIPKPKYNLNVSGGNHGEMTGKMLIAIELVLLEEKPDLVLVYGDTNSTLAGALAASKLHIKVAHIEAGLRSFNFKMPEEQNRILTDNLSTLLFCPTDTSLNNLMKEGVNHRKIHLVGDVMQDAAIHFSKLAKCPEDLNITELENGFVLSTIHRAENTDSKERLGQIVDAINEISNKIKVVLPLHPRTKAKLKEYGLEISATVIDPVGYFEMLYLIDNSKIVISDSGGLQKEAFFFSKPCLTLRDETEWIELVEKGVNFLTGANKNLILSSFDDLLHVKVEDENDLYGGGKASSNIVNKILEVYKGQSC